jgi:CubicO group peptidase (beta-lactamase class C family)
MNIRIAWIIAISIIATSAVYAAGLKPPSKPESVGFSSERLQRITDHMNKHVDSGHFTGATGLIARQGKIVYFETYGDQDREEKIPMADDTIFRIYSMTKAITGVAVMREYEKGKFFLNHPVSKYLPEFKDMKVAAKDGLVDAENEITIRDLLMHTSGITYGGGGNSAKYYREAGARTPGMNLAEFSEAIASAPLEFEPGTEWWYGFSIDILGRLVEVVSGKPFEVYLQEEIFAPLGMKDSAFYVPEENHDRLVKLYTPNDDGGVSVNTGRAQNSYKTPPSYPGGGGGMVSTTMDYARFCQMLVNNGELDGNQILGRKSVELMRADHLGDIPKNGALIARDGVGFGLTFAVLKDIGATGEIDSNGSYNWGGAAGTRFWIDPKEELIGVFMINILPYNGLPYGDEFKRLTYQAIVD